jgi:hypothetical protein
MTISMLSAGHTEAINGTTARNVNRKRIVNVEQAKNDISWRDTSIMIAGRLSRTDQLEKSTEEEVTKGTKTTPDGSIKMLSDVISDDNLQPSSFSGTSLHAGDKNIIASVDFIEEVPHQQQVISDSITPGKSDILSGRGRTSFDHAGNQALRAMIIGQLGAYVAARQREEKTAIASQIVMAVKDSGGKFLKRHEGGKTKPERTWFEMQDVEARRKVSHAFRDAHSEMLSNKGGSKKRPTNNASRKKPLSSCKKVHRQSSVTKKAAGVAVANGADATKKLFRQIQAADYYSRSFLPPSSITETKVDPHSNKAPTPSFVAPPSPRLSEMSLFSLEDLHPSLLDPTVSCLPVRCSKPYLIHGQDETSITSSRCYSSSPVPMRSSFGMDSSTTAAGCAPQEFLGDDRVLVVEDNEGWGITTSFTSYSFDDLFSSDDDDESMLII